MISPLAMQRPETAPTKFKLSGVSIGIGLSLLLHCSLFTLYYLKPNSISISQPAAAPMAVLLNMPFASPKMSQTQASHKAQAQIRQKAGAKAQPKEKQTPLKKTRQQTTTSSTIALPKKTKKKTKTTVKKQGNASSTVVQDAKAPAAILTPKRAKQLSAPNRGRMSRQTMQARMSWVQLLFAHIDQFKQYPRKAKRLGIQGTPKVELTMNRQGQVLALKLLQSSGNQDLDKEALAMIKRAQPLPKPPEKVKGATLVLKVPLLFHL